MGIERLSNARRKGQRRVVIATAVIFLVAAAYAIGYREIVGFPANPMTQDQAQAMIRRDIPLGSGVDSVERWLAEKGYDFSFDNSKYMLSVEAAAEGGRFSSKDMGGAVEAIIRDTDRSFMVSGNLQLTFFFNKSLRLIGHRVQWIGTGP